MFSYILQGQQDERHRCRLHDVEQPTQDGRDGGWSGRLPQTGRISTSAFKLHN